MPGGGSIQGMITMLKNNELIKNKISHFQKGSKTKYTSSQLNFKIGTKEDIDKIQLKFKKQKRRLIFKQTLILLFSISVLIMTIYYLFF